MPRNPGKTRCTTPNCRNWAMRNHSLCRSHRDRELGPRGGGAQPGNLSAVRTGRGTHPFSPTDLQATAIHLIQHPTQLTATLTLLVEDIQSRGAADPERCLVALRTTLDQLLPHVSAALFMQQASDLLADLPPEARVRFLRNARRPLVTLAPSAALREIRKLARTAKEGQ